jgi:hypothetical protein
MAPNRILARSDPLCIIGRIERIRRILGVWDDRKVCGLQGFEMEI